MPIVKKPFTITSAHGTMLYSEGQSVGKEIADKFPQFMEGYKDKEVKPHNPNLPIKVSETQAGKMTEASLLAWIEQYHPHDVPKEKVDKATLVNLVVELQTEG